MEESSSSRCLTALVSVANLLILILAIIIMCLSLGNWNDYATCSFTILVVLCWTCCVCLQNNKAISCYTVFMIMDMLLLLANAIFYSIMSKKYNDFCYDLRAEGTAPFWGCHDWRLSGKPRTIGMLICFYIAFAFRLFSIVGSCLLARSMYQAKPVPY